MTRPSVLATLATALKDIDPRRSLMAATIWLVAVLAFGFAAAASYWAGSAAETIVVQQHVRRLALETQQLAWDLSQALNARLLALRADEDAGSAVQAFQHLNTTSKELDWLMVADATGTIVGASDAHAVGSDARRQQWFAGGLNGVWIGTIPKLSRAPATPVLGAMSAPLRGHDGTLLGVVAARLSWYWSESDVKRLSRTLNPQGSAQTVILDRDGTVLAGPDSLLNVQWPGILLKIPPPIEPSSPPGQVPRFERMPDGRAVLVARAPLTIPFLHDPGWQVQLSELRDEVYQRANALRLRILEISASLALIIGIIGALAARHLTDRLKRLTRSAAAAGQSESSRIDVPAGSDEVAQLGRAFAKVLEELQQERRELRLLSEDLERRVGVRTREVERLAEESRYSAIVRERLKIARDLHDTLAHSMMAMLAEVRLLRKLHVSNPQALAEELEHAETVAHDGLNEARDAIAQMRVNSVRDTGLGAALKTVFDRFIDRTGIAGNFSADPEAARFGDERAETLLRMAEEALRNVEKHARASRTDVLLGNLADGRVELLVTDDGCGFDPLSPRSGHFGLIGLREQAQFIGAHLEIKSAVDSGSSIRVILRIAPQDL